MIIKKTTTISVNVKDPSEYNWWLNHKDDLKEKGCILDERSTECYFANYVETYSVDLGADDK